ncbi:MAG: hypothetical protein RDU47_02395 [Spirochaetia bacterium]|nr:hypothetical protein [Spirochaetia bacterium]
MTSGTIIHVNVIGLMAAVEEIVDPGVRGRPFVVARPDIPRAIVLDLSPEAYREGVRRGMLVQTACARVRALKVVPPRPELYEKVDQSLLEAAFCFTPLVERAGRGHLFLDVNGTRRLFGSPEDAARRLLGEIADQTGLVPTVALASTKTAAKVASRVFRPFGFAPLSVNDEGELVARQPVELLPGVGVKLLPRLISLEIGEIGTLASLSMDEAQAISARGPELVLRARCVDDSPVNPEPPSRRMLAGETVFEPDCADPDLLAWRAREIVAELGFRMRKEGFGAHFVMAKLVYTDGAVASRSVRAGQGASFVADIQLYEAAERAVRQAWERRVRVRKLQIELGGFEPAGPELDLFEPLPFFKAEPEIDSTGIQTRRIAMHMRVQSALDRVHGKYGQSAIVPAAAFLYREGSLVC